MYRTLYFRYLGQKKYGELESMLFDGAVLLFTHKEIASGTDLAKLYVDALNQAEAPPEELHFQRISKLYQLIPCDNVEKPVYLSACLKWSTTDGAAVGNPRLHQHIAYTLWQAKQYPESRQHFLHSQDGLGCGHMLVEFHLARGFSSEVDLFIAQTVLQYLCLKKSLAAAAAFHAFTADHPTLKENQGPPFPSHPLLNFIWFLLLSIQTSQSLAIYTVLCEKYKQVIDRDPQYLEYLDKIGQHFFGVPAPVKRKPGGMFSGLIDQLMTAMNDESSDDEASAGPSGGQNTARSSQPKKTVKANIKTEELD